MTTTLQFERISPDTAALQATILNSDAYFNQISKNKDLLSTDEIAEEHRESEAIGAVRFLLKHGERSVGILEYLPKNPSDGYPWLGLLQIDKQYQGQGYGVKALQTFYNYLHAQEIGTLRIGVIESNEPAHRFWQKRGYQFIKSSRNQDNLEVIVYEITLD